MRTLGILASSFLLVLSLPAGTRAFPIAPLTLWDLITRSERIVVARVESIEPASNGRIARLRVIENWKGPFTEVVRVRFPSGMICPAPPRYIEGRDVLAFLEAETGSGSDSELWMTVGLSYGTLYPRAEEHLFFWRLVHQLQRAKPPYSQPLVKDWHVEAASHRATRWHGLYRLVPSSDVLHSFYDSEAPPKLSDLLSAEDRERIGRGFLREPSSDLTFPMTLELLHDYRSTELDTTAVGLVEGLLLREPPPYWTALAMVLVWERFGHPDGASRLARPAKPDGDPLLDASFWDRDRAELMEAWATGRRELGIPSVPPLVVREDEVGGVGAFTPP